MSEVFYCVLLVLTAIGFLCAGIALQQPRVLHWRIEWIKLEHDLARLQGREPRNIDALSAERKETNG